MTTDYADPHASKISPDDPRLRLPSSKTRRLRRGPAFAAIGGILVLIFVSVAVATSGPSRRKRGSEEEEDLSKALRQPPLPAELVRAPDYVPPPRVPDPQPSSAQGSERALVPLPTTTALHEPSGRANTGPYSAQALRQKQIEELWQARKSGIFVESRERDSDRAPAERDHRPPSVPTADELGSAPPQRLPPLPAQDGMGELGVDDQAHKEAFLRGGVRGDGYLHARLERPRSPYEIKPGSVIPAVLTTAINSDLPGPVFARVREDVYDTVTGQYLLIPQNSTLVASYDSRVIWGQERVLMCWRELILPNGSSLKLDCMPAADLAGAAGLTDEVDEHWWRLAKGVALASLLSAGTAAAGGSTTGYNPTISQQVTRGAATEFGRAGDRIAQREIRVQPTIKIRPGWSLNVMVVQNLVLEPYPLE